jgi:hypothetical protein
MSFAQGLSAASTDAPVAAALVPPCSTPLAHRASAAILNSKDLRDDQYPQPKGMTFAPARDVSARRVDRTCGGAPTQFSIVAARSPPPTSNAKQTLSSRAAPLPQRSRTEAVA